MKGRENALSVDQIMDILGCGYRQVTAAVARERADGAVILSSSNGKTGGFFLPSDDPEKALREITTYRRSMEHRAKKVFIAARSARKEEKRLADIVSGQGVLNVD